MKKGRFISPLVHMLVFVGMPLSAAHMQAQSLIRDNGQMQFKSTLQAGNYSGIAHVESNVYALADDKAPHDGFRYVTIDIDSVTGKIKHVQNVRQVDATATNRDAEGVVYIPSSQTLMVVGEADSRIVEYTRNGEATGKELLLPKGNGNAGYESLAYDDVNHLLWTCTEGPLPDDLNKSFSKIDTAYAGAFIRIQAYDTNMKAVGVWPYMTDQPMASRENARNYAFGVSELLTVGDSTLLVLEREFYVPHSMIGSWVQNKIYKVKLQHLLCKLSDKQGTTNGNNAEMLAERPVAKELLYSWRTHLTLLGRSLANYEGMCLGPQLQDGSQVIILVADSQNQAYGALRDWFRTLVVR